MQSALRRTTNHGSRWTGPARSQSLYRTTLTNVFVSLHFLALALKVFFFLLFAPLFLNRFRPAISATPAERIEHILASLRYDSLTRSTLAGENVANPSEVDHWMCCGLDQQLADIFQAGTLFFLFRMY
jgi:hypothetical protein